ncbi:MAG: NADH-quinone oxidoreductase subunit N [Anaerolineae bacterium]|nr:NADH-quinone oxidoreductase subunit N [Anaerolineae bacterium]
MDFQTVDWAASLLAILPEILLTVLAVLILVLDLVWPVSRRREIGVITAVLMFGIVLVTLVFGVPSADGSLSDQLLLGGMIRHDLLAQIFRVIVILAGALTCLISVDSSLGRKGQYYALIVISTLGASLMSAAADLVMVFVALETTSISLYMLAGFIRNDEKSAESGLKYFLFGAMTSAVTLYGLSLLYGFTGQTNIYLLGEALAAGNLPGLPVLVALIMVVVGFGFKISAVPFHFWTPDVYEGAPTPITAFISVGSKAASFALLMRFFMAVFPGYDTAWVELLAVSAAVTMTLGNLLALAQSNLKRMLAYSSIAQAGYALIGVVAISSMNGQGLAAVSFYMFMYAATNIIAFAVAAIVARATGSDKIADLAGLSRRNPALALALTVALLSLGGIPPAAGFFGKFYLFNAAVDANFVWLALVGVINAIVALYYYLTVVKVMYVDRHADDDKPIAISAASRWALIIGAFIVLFLGIIPAPVYNWALEAGRGLLLF